jgi:chromosome segregation ATPase
MGANREHIEALRGEVERQGASAETKAAELLSELAAVRAVAEEASSGVAELRDELQALRGETAAVREQAELANAIAEKANQTASTAKLDDEKVAALQAEVLGRFEAMEVLR